MSRIKTSFLSLLLFILSFTTVWAVFGNITSNIVISGETTVNTFTTFIPAFNDADYFWKMFFSSNHSFFLVSLITHLCSIVLPIFTNMHPQNFYHTFGWQIYLIIFWIFCLVQTLNASKYFKHGIFGFLTFWIVFPFIINSLKVSYTIWFFYNDTWFLCYILNSIFPLLLFGILEKNYVMTGKIIPPLGKQKFDLLLFTVLSLIILTGIGHELYRFVLCGILAITFILNNILLKEKIETKKFLFFFSYTVAASCFVFLLPSFDIWWNSCVNTPVPQMITYFSSIKVFVQHVIVPNLPILFFISAFSVAAYFSTENKTFVKRLLIYLFSCCFSLLLFNYIIIVISNLNVDISQHNGIKFLTNSVLVFTMFSIIGFLITHCSIKYKKFVNIELAIFFVFASLFVSSYGIKFIKDHEYFSKKYREIQYIVEKAYDLYGKDNNVIYASYGTNTVMEDTIFYLRYWYGSNDKYYKPIYVCNEQTDDEEKCQKKMVDILYEKTKYYISKEELEKTDFSTLKNYNARKKQGQISFESFNKIIP